MQAIINDLSYFLTKAVKTVLDVGKMDSNDPIVKMKLKQGHLILECSTATKGIRASMPVTVKEEGVSYLMASSLKAIKSSYKTAKIKKTDNKVNITSEGKGRKFSISLNTVDKDKYSSFLDMNTKELPESKIKLNINDLQSAISSINISPLLIPGDEQSLISISTVDKQTRILIHDSYRIAALHIPSRLLKVKEELNTDFKELSNTIQILSNISDNAAIGYNDKLLSAIGEKDGYRLQLLMSHNLPKKNIIDRTKTIFEMQMEKKALFAFVANKSFKEGLENAIAVGSSSGHININIGKDSVSLSGAVPSSSYKESVQLSKGVVGEGGVKLGSAMIVDVLKLMSDTPIIKVTDSACIIKSKTNDAKSYFILPILVYYDA